MTKQDKVYFTRQERIEILKESITNDIDVYQRLFLRLSKFPVTETENQKSTFKKIQILEKRAVFIYSL